MDEQRAWIKSRRKRRLRILAAALAFCLLITTYPDILATLSALAAGTQDGDGTVYVTGFAELPEEVREQTVPLGTGIEELTLPDTLEVFVTITEEEDAAEEEAPDKKKNPDDSGSKEEGTVSGAGTETGTDETGGETGDGTAADGGTETGDSAENNGDSTENNGGETDNSGDSTENNGGETETGDNSETGGDTGNSGDSTDNNGGTGTDENNGDSTETGGETDNNGDSTDSNGGDQNTGETPAETTGNTDNTEAQQEQSAPEESAPEGQAIEENTLQESAGTDVSAAEPAAFSQETHTVTLPVYAAGNELDIEMLKPSPAGEADSADTGAADNADDNADSTDSTADDNTASGTDSSSASGGSTYAAPQDSPAEQSAHTEQVTVENITWESDPAYDAETEGVYVFTPVLPEGYALSEGVSLPEIRVEAEMMGQTLTPEQYAHMIAGLQDSPALLTEEDVLEAAPELAPQTYGLMRAAAAGHPGTYLTTDDNEDNAGSGNPDGDLDKYVNAYSVSHPIEANIFIDEGQLPQKSCYIAVRAYDVNWRGLGDNEAEYDKLFVNGVRVGTLTGLINEWNTSYYRVPLSCLKEGKNTVRVEIWDCTDSSRFGDDNPPLKANGKWAAGIDWMQLVCDGGCGSREDVEEFSLTLNAENSTLTSTEARIGVDTVIQSSDSSAAYHTEYSIVDSKGFIVGSFQEQNVKSGSHGITVAMPLDSETGTYTVQGMLKNAKGEILATDSAQFQYIKNKGPILGPKVSHTLSIETLTNRDVTVTPVVVNAAGCTNITFSPASRTAKANGTCNFTVRYTSSSGSPGSTVYTAEVTNIDKVKPVITYDSSTVISAETAATAAEQLEQAWTVTDDVSPREKCRVTYSIDCTKPEDFKKLRQAAGSAISITVAATDEAGNSSTLTSTVKVAPLPPEIGVPTAVRSGATNTFTLTAEVTAAVGSVTESGFVWGTMQKPTLAFNQSSSKNALDVKTNGKIQVKAPDIVDGVTYYCRAYAKAGGVTYYSEQASFGINAKSYGTFTVKNNNNSTFTITRTGGTDGAQTVYFRTVNGSAVGGTHFEHKAGTAVFGQGETTKTITVTEKGVATAYGGKTSTSYSNDNRTYFFEIYRVDGGGTLGSTVRAGRTMTKNSSYTVRRTLYTTDNERNVSVNDNNKWVADNTDYWWRKVVFINDRGKNAAQGNKNFNVQRTMDAGTARENAYLKATADGYSYRLQLNATETDNGYEHIWISNHAPNNMRGANNDNHTDYESIPLDYSYFGHAYYTGRWEIAYHKTGTRTASFPSGKDLETGWFTDNLLSYEDDSRISDDGWVLFDLNDTAHVWFAANGNKKNMWYVNYYTDWVKIRDTKEPRLVGVAPMAGGTYKAGDEVFVSLVFDEIVDKTNSSLDRVSINTSWGTFAYEGGADTNVLYFRGKVPSNATETLKVTGINGSQYIKDMCGDDGSAPAGSGSVTVKVDTTTPTVSITNTGITNGTAKGTVSGTNVNTLRYAWTESAAMPVTGWTDCTNGTVAKTRQTSGTWYLHVLGTYAGTGKSAWTYKKYDFGTPDNPASPLPSLKLSADNTQWAKERPITITEKIPADASLTVKTPSGKTENIGTASSYTAKENGMYAFSMTVDGEPVEETVNVSRLDHTAPELVLKEAGETKDSDGSYILYHTLRMTATAADRESGIQTVKYCFTSGDSAPAADSGSWQTATATNGIYVFEKVGESTSAETFYLHVMVTDKVGNAGTASSQGYRLVKEQPVEATLTEPTDWTNGNATLTWKITSAGAGNCTVSRGETILKTGQNVNATGTFTVENNGVYSISVRDKNGSTASVLCAVNHIDREAPEFNVSAPSGNAAEKTVTLSGVNDNLTSQYNETGRTGFGGSQVKTREYQAPGTDTWTEFTGDSFTASKNGTYQVKLTDNAGNESIQSVEVSGVDATAPTAGCTILSGPDASESGWYTENPFRVKLTYADGTAGSEGGTPSGIASVQYKWVTGSAATPATGLTKLNAAAVAAGEYTLNLGYYDNAEAYFLYYKVTDKTGNETDGFSEEIKKDSYKGSGTVTGPSEGQSEADGLAMQLTSLTYGPSGGKVTGGPADNETDLVTLPGHESGQITLGSNPGYTAKDTGEHYFRIYPAARNSGNTASSYYWAFYVRKVTFDCQGGPEVPAQLVWHDSTSDVKCKVAVPTKPKRTGYTFGGWYTDAACTAEFNFDTQLRADTTLYAKWTANTYTVTYHLTNPDGTEKTDFGESYQSYTYGKGLTLPAPEWKAKTGFAFDGWYADANFTDADYKGPAYTAIGETATGDKEYYGRFKDVEAPKLSGSGLNGTWQTYEKEGLWYRDKSSSERARFTTNFSDNNGADNVTGYIIVDGKEATKEGVIHPSSASFRYYLLEGEHTYQWKLVDAAGNVALSEKKTYKYDKTRPTTGTITYDGVAGAVKVTDSDNRFVYYLCGNKEVVLSVPVADALSGVDMLRWLERKKGDEGVGGLAEKQLSGKNEETVKLTFGPGTAKEMWRFECFDKAWVVNSSYADFKDPLVDGTQSTSVRWIGIIVEDTKPNITIADYSSGTEQPLSKGWYESPPSRFQVTMNDTGATGDTKGGAISSGIKYYVVYVNGRLTTANYNPGGWYDKLAHGIPFPADAKGVVNITVEVEDYAGNTATKSVDVKIKGQEQTPAAKPDYPNDALSGLAPKADYKITVPVSGGGSSDYTVTSDGNGRIPFVLDGSGEEGEGTAADICGKTISIVKLGVTENGQKCSDNSTAQELTIVGRPEAIDVGNIDVTPEVMPETGNAVINLTIAGDSSAKEYRWEKKDGSQKDAWKDVPEAVSNISTVQNLKAGNIFVRVKATDNAPHGLRSSAKEITAASNTIKAVFELNGVGASGKPQDQTVNKGSDVLAEPDVPTREGYDFTGWYMESDCQTKWRFEEEDGQAAHMVRDWRKSRDSASFDPVTVNEQLTITLYAGWRENVKPTLTPKLTTPQAGGSQTDVTNQDGWYPNLSLSLDYSDNVAVTKLSVSVDGGADQDLSLSGTENGTDDKRNKKYTINYSGIREGEHTYTFKAGDAAGNVTETSVTGRLDTGEPSLGAAAFEVGHRSFWDWIVGKKTLQIIIPVTETLSGVGSDGVKYTLRPEGGTGTETTGYMTPSGSTENGYTATISIDTDFKGKIEITATDKAGNVSDTQTIGADGSGIKGVIVESNAPEITILADREPTDFSSTRTETQAEAETDKITNNTNIDTSGNAAYYNSAPRLYVKVTDAGTNENGKTTSGLKSVTWRSGSIDGGAEHDAGLNFTENILTEHSFTISALEGAAGEVQVTVTATDQADNKITMTVPVRIKAREEKPAPVIDYINEKLKNLVPNGIYKLLDTDGTEKEITADADGCIKIEEEWFGREVQLCKTGNGSTTLDSVKTDVKPAARPAPPKVEVSQNETKQGKADGIIGRTDSALDLTTLEYSTDGGESWTAVTAETDATALKPFKLSADKTALENCAAGPCLFRVRAANDAPHAAPCGEQMEVIVAAGTPLTLSFEEKGGSEIEDITGLSYHDSVKKPKDPVRAGYALAGWYTDDACSEGKQWQFASGQTPDETADKIEEDTTLYAKWVDAAKPALSAVLVNPVNNGNADGGQWYGRLSAALTYSDNEGVTALYVGVDLTEEAEKGDSYAALSLTGATASGTGADGSDQYLLYDNDLTEGAHTYTFKAVDAAGNKTTAELTARLDTTAPVIGTVSYEKDPANLWDWIIGKESLIITLPVTEKGSGVEAVDYVLTPDGDGTGTATGTAKIRKLSGSGTGADFEAEITVPADFKGKVKVAARDYVGNSSEKTLGVEQDSKDKNGIIVEDNAPDIQFAIEGGEVAETYYETAPQVDIAVDDTGWAGKPDGAGQTKAVSLTTGGIASVVCTITSGTSRNEYKPGTDYTTAMKTSDSFAIPADQLFAGINTITVTAVDHAGNTAVKTVTVKVKTPEGTPNAKIGYVAETLNNLVPNAEYRIDGLGMRADAKGSVPIDESWIGRSTPITVVQMGSAESMTESAPQKVALPARPEAPAVTVTDETYPNAGDGILTMTEADKVYQYSADGLTWKDAETGADKEIKGLAAKDYYVRAKAIENTSFRSKEGTVTIGTTPPEPYDPPQTKIDYENEMLSKLEPGAEYIIEYGGDPNDPDDEVVTVIITADKDGKIPVKPEWQGEELSIVQKSNGKEKSDSPQQLLTIPVRPEAPNPSGEDETGIRTGAKLTNLTAGKAYDISRDDGKSWLRKTADGNGVISGVDAPAAYIVRVAAVGGFKSPNSGKVTVDGFHIPVTYMADGSAYDTSWAYYGKAPQNIPAVPPKADAGDATYVGEWCADVNGAPADLKNITDVTTVYAYYTVGYNVILKGIPGCTLAAAPGSASPVKEGADFTLQFTLGNGYEKTDGFAVKVDGVKIELKEDGTYTIENITEDHTVTVEGIRKKPSSGGPDHDSDDQTGGDNNPPAGDNPADGSTTPGGTTPGGTKPGTENPGGTTPDGTNPDGTSPDGKKPGQTDADEQKPGGADDKNPGRTDADGKTPGETDTDRTKPGGKFPHKEVPDGKTPGGSDFPDGVKLPDGTKLTGIIVPVTIEDGRLVLLPGTPDGGGTGTDSTGGGDGTGADGTGTGGTADGSGGNGAGNGSTADGNAGNGSGTGSGTGDSSGTDSAAAVPAGNVPGMEAEGVILQVADGGGTVIVTVICEDKEYTAGVADTIAVANAVLTPEQIELVGGGETIEILIDVKDITDSVPLRDKEIIENGIEAGRKDHPGLTLGMYIDISMFVKVGKGDWNTITHTKEPVDVVIGIPETLKAEGREFTIIRSHDGEYTLLPDLDDNPDTITISTDLFSAYAIAYEQADQTDGNEKCGLCHICPTFLGICCFIWLAVIVAAVLLIWILVRSRKEEEEQKTVK